MSDLINRKTVISVAESCTFSSSYDRTRYMDFLHYCLNTAPTVDAVPLTEIYRVIAGHSVYQGDSILAALTCIAEGKNVKPIKPVDAVPVVHAKWIAQNDALTRFMCSNCKSENHEGFETYCPKCGAKMDLR